MLYIECCLHPGSLTTDIVAQSSHNNFIIMVNNYSITYILPFPTLWGNCYRPRIGVRFFVRREYIHCVSWRRTYGDQAYRDPLTDNMWMLRVSPGRYQMSSMRYEGLGGVLSYIEPWGPESLGWRIGWCHHKGPFRLRDVPFQSSPIYLTSN